MATQEIGLSNLQKELLQLYGNNVSNETLFEIKAILARFFADRASAGMDEVWQEKNLTPNEMTAWINEHNRVEIEI